MKANRDYLLDQAESALYSAKQAAEKADTYPHEPRYAEKAEALNRIAISYMQLAAMTETSHAEGR